jgi:hypothetical protein
MNSARVYLGLTQAAGNRPAGGIPEPAVPCRIRTFGRPTAMTGTIPGLNEQSSAGPSLTVVGAARHSLLEGEVDRQIILAAALAIAVIVATSLDGHRARVAAAISLALILAASAVAGGPVMLASGLCLAAVALRSGQWPVVIGQ